MQIDKPLGMEKYKSSVRVTWNSFDDLYHSDMTSPY